MTVDRGVELRLLRFRPEGRPTATPVLFVAGWVSVIEGWADLVVRLAQRREVLYLETREKPSARLAADRLGVEQFMLARLAEDLVQVWRQAGLGDGGAVAFGSSMGANAILEALKGHRLPAAAAFVIGPNSDFHFPWWSPALLAMPCAAYPVLRPFVLWYLSRFRVDARAEPEQVRRYERTLRSAHPLRLKRSAKAIRDYTVWPGIDTIHSPVGLAFASSDRLHGEGAVRRIAAAIPRGEAISCASNTYMHTAAVADDLDSFLSRVGLS